MKLRTASLLVGLTLVCSVSVVAEAKQVRAAIPGGPATVSFDDFLWKAGAPVGNEVLFTCRQRECGGSASLCTAGLTKTSGSAVGVRDALVRGMEQQLITKWTGHGAVGMTTVEKPREMMHGENMGAFASFNATWQKRATLMTFFFVPANGFAVSVACFMPQDSVSAGIWEVHTLLAGIKVN